MDQRLHGLDFLRALMMMLGIVLHGAQMYMTMNLGFDYYRDPASSPSMDALLIFINTFRMPVFFALSGFFTALLLGRYQLRGMVENRLRRIALPMLVFLPPLSVILSLQWIMATNLTATGHIGFNAELLPYPELLWNNTHHLWFLYYLLIILGIHSAALWLLQLAPQGPRQRITALLSRVSLKTPLVFAGCGLVFGALAYPVYVGRLLGNIIWQPAWPAVGFFAICYLMGWCLYSRQQVLQTLARDAWLYLVAALLCLVLALAAFFNQGEASSSSYRLLHPLLAFGNGLSVSFFIAALLGLFSRYCNHYNPWTRYFSDAAYWIFLLHQPVLLLLALPLYHWDTLAEIKFLLVSVGTLLLCTLSYHYWVRNTALGVLLNGRRYPQLWPWQVDHAQKDASAGLALKARDGNT